jgi:hypothetical protein
MVSKWWMRAWDARGGRIGRQWKIYGKSGARLFSQIFSGLISMQTLGLYPRPVVVEWRAVKARNDHEKWTTGSQDVVPAAFDVLARAGAGAPAQGQDA